MQACWMVRAGEHGRLFDEFTKGYIAIGFNEMGDVSDVKSMEELKLKYLKAYPDVRAGAVANQVAILFKFLRTLETGQKVITYSPTRREYLVGTIAGDYTYGENVVGDYPHYRKVHWDGTISRDVLSVSTRNSLGSTLTLFAVDDAWEEIQSVMSGGAAQLSLTAELDELDLAREETIDRAHELIKDRILELDDREMELLTAAILRAMGYRARVSPVGPDRGVDVMASPDGLGLEQPRIKAEVKHRPKTPIGPQVVRSFLGGLREGDRGLFVSTGGFTKESRYEADRSSIPVALIDLDTLAELVVAHYENFDIDGRTLVPLVKVYWPK